MPNRLHNDRPSSVQVATVICHAFLFLFPTLALFGLFYVLSGYCKIFDGCYIIWNAPRTILILVIDLLILTSLQNMYIIELAFFTLCPIILSHSLSLSMMLKISSVMVKLLSESRQRKQRHFCNQLIQKYLDVGAKPRKISWLPFLYIWCRTVLLRSPFTSFTSRPSFGIPGVPKTVYQAEWILYRI